MDLLSSVTNGVRTIRFNNPAKKNALSLDNYEQITKILNEDAENDNVVITIFTGVGEYFTSGNDFSSSMAKLQTMDMESILKEASIKFKSMIQAFLNYPKILISVVNGPAIGIGATMCALCDIVYASNTATFLTPFVKLGLCAEGCSSYTFPMILGKSKASEMLYLGHKMSAEEALSFNFISKIIPKHEIDLFIEKLHEYGTISVNSVIINKKLVKDVNIKKMSQCNDRECIQLIECQMSEEFFNNMNAFMARKKSKL